MCAVSHFVIFAFDEYVANWGYFVLIQKKLEECVFKGWKMSGKCRRKIGSRAYRNYTDETLSEALNEIRSNKLSIRKASEKYGIHRNTMWLKLKGKNTSIPGHPTVFSREEEEAFVSHCIVMSNFGFPVTGFDLRCIVKSYLDRSGRTVSCFRNNFPGTDWQNSFIGRHRVLTQRFAQNISIARAAVNDNVINQFFDHLEVALDGVPASNIWNYDETNLVDDPGSHKIITKRGTKYPEKIRNSTKACTSLMFCGNAEGQLAPMYVNYKAKNLWSTWTEGGPQGARYNCTSSGWFDYNTFEDFFMQLMLPILRRQDGPKAFIGDNLSSHLNVEVIRICEEHNIRFIALPPNATHLLQPLDVAFFRPLKRNWKCVLSEWKESASGARCITIPKQEFPALLQKLMEKVKENGAKNLSSGFRKCGIHPLNRQEVLVRLGVHTAENEKDSIREVVSDSFIQHLSQKRTEMTERRQVRRRKINITPGKSVSVLDLHTGSTSDTNIPAEPSTSCGTRRNKPKRCRIQENDTSSDSNEGSVIFAESDNSWQEESDSEAEISLLFREEDKIVGNFVIVAFEETYYPGIITGISKNKALVNVMESVGKNWRWPEQKDEIWYEDSEIVSKICAPRQMGKRQIFEVPELTKMCQK